MGSKYVNLVDAILILLDARSFLVIPFRDSKFFVPAFITCGEASELPPVKAAGFPSASIPIAILIVSGWV